MQLRPSGPLWRVVPKLDAEGTLETSSSSITVAGEDRDGFLFVKGGDGSAVDGESSGRRRARFEPLIPGAALRRPL